MPIKGKQIVDNTITQKQLGVVTESIAQPTDVTTKKYVDSTVDSAVTGLTYTDIDYNISATDTTGESPVLATDHQISKIPVGGVRVYVNGLEINVGPGLMSFFAPESSGTPTPREFEEEQQGDYLWWDPSIAKYQLESTDDIDFVYRTYTEEYPIISNPINIANDAKNVDASAQTGISESITITGIDSTDLSTSVTDTGLIQSIFVSNVQLVINGSGDITSFTFDVSENTSSSPRTNTIKIYQTSNPDVFDTIDIIQAGSNITYYITFDNDEGEYTNGAQTGLSESISSNVPALNATATVVETNPFVSDLNVTSGADDTVIGVSFNITENTGSTYRTNTIKVEHDEDSSIYDTIIIKQYPSPSITIDPTSLTLDLLDESFTVDVTSNVPWTASVSFVSGQNFITGISPNNGDGGSSTVTITCTVDDPPASGEPDNVSDIKINSASPFSSTTYATCRVTQPASH